MKKILNILAIAVCSIGLVFTSCKKEGVKSIDLDKTELRLEVGATHQLAATTNPAGEKLTWTSSSSGVATVDNAGFVTAVKEGQAIITAKAGDKTAVCSVTVTKEEEGEEVKSVTLDQPELSLEEGATHQLVATTDPAGKKVTWTTSSSDVATVSPTGLVTAVKEGKATITAKAGDKTATCTVAVTKEKEEEIKSVTLDYTELSLEEGAAQQLIATTDPVGKDVAWTTSSSDVATVSAEGLVTAVKEGQATITAKAGDQTATCAVTVAKKEEEIKSVTLDYTELSLEEGAAQQLIATTDPVGKDVAWTTSLPEVATVSAEGLVTAVKEGQATITAKAGDKTATCVVIVTKEESVFSDSLWAIDLLFGIGKAKSLEELRELEEKKQATTTREFSPKNSLELFHAYDAVSKDKWIGRVTYDKDKYDENKKIKIQAISFKYKSVGEIKNEYDFRGEFYTMLEEAGMTEFYSVNKGRSIAFSTKEKTNTIVCHPGRMYHLGELIDCVLVLPGQFHDLLSPASGTKSFVTTIPLPDIL